MKGSVVSLRDSLGLHTGWLVLDEDGRELGRCTDGRGLRGDATNAVAMALIELSASLPGKTATTSAMRDRLIADCRKVELGDLCENGAGKWFPWSWQGTPTAPVECRPECTACRLRWTPVDEDSTERRCPACVAKESTATTEKPLDSR